MVDGALKDKKKRPKRRQPFTPNLQRETAGQNVLRVPFKNIAQKNRVGRPEQLFSLYRSLYLTLFSSPLSSVSSPGSCRAAARSDARDQLLRLYRTREREREREREMVGGWRVGSASFYSSEEEEEEKKGHLVLWDQQRRAVMAGQGFNEVVLRARSR